VRSVGELAEADLRALQVDQDRDGAPASSAALRTLAKFASWTE
jgi:hypothetical protein